MAQKSPTASQPLAPSPSGIESAPLPEPPELFPIKEVVADLIRARGYHEGLFDLGIEFSIGVGSFGPTPEQVAPGVVLGVGRIGLQRVMVVGPHTVDAKQVNPPPKARKTKA
jgi:hypothetical protein